MLGGRLLFKKLAILDKPKADQTNKRKPVPTILGVFLILSFVVIITVIFPEYLGNRVVWGLLAGGLIIGIPAFFDELHYLGKIKWDMPISIRFISHILAAIVAVYLGDISIAEWSI
jgi:UDP-N-acetylmuramyl pentapeptide phosphotransferase/UDP-N-acetylglucosamine-1-phosphate transferase